MSAGPNSTAASAELDVTARGAGLVAAVESVALAVYCVVLAITATNSAGATESAPIVEISIFAIFALGIALVARGMLRGRTTARPPFILTQLFVLITAYTVWAGDGTTVKVVGALIGLLGLAGLVLGIASIAREPSPEAAADPGVADAPDGTEGKAGDTGDGTQPR
ncbi:MAG: hypothetical protein ACOYD1_13075 [Candidatus Nanopelagicales bacterium]